MPAFCAHAGSGLRPCNRCIQNVSEVHKMRMGVLCVVLVWFADITHTSKAKIEAERFKLPQRTKLKHWFTFLHACAERCQHAASTIEHD